MGIDGLENNYYLSGNDIWVRVTSTDDRTPLKLELLIENQYTFKTLPAFRMYPNPTQEIKFNISLPIRALQPDPDQVVPQNSLSKFSLTFNLTYTDNTTETVEMDVIFIRGGVNKRGADNWYLSSSTPLVVGKWIEWNGITLPGSAYRIQGDFLTTFQPSGDMVYRQFIPGNCNYKIIKFLNSLGGYQFFVFEYNERELTAKGLGTLPVIADELKFDNSRSLGIDESETLNLKCKTPEEIQPVFLDLLKSFDVYLYHPEGNEPYSQWERLEIAGSNKGLLNSRDKTYMNEVTFKIPNYVNREL